MSVSKRHLRVAFVFAARKGRGLVDMRMLVEQVVRGEPFVIAKAVSLDLPDGAQARRIGFLAGLYEAPDDFDSISGV